MQEKWIKIDLHLKYDTYAHKTETSVFICGSFIDRDARSHFYVQFVFYWRLCHCPRLINLSVKHIILRISPLIITVEVGVVYTCIEWDNSFTV